MGHKFPLYILYLSIAKKFLAVHEPSPLDLEEADIQISLHEQIVPCIHLFTRQTFPQCLCQTETEVGGRRGRRCDSCFYFGPGEAHLLAEKKEG